MQIDYVSVTPTHTIHSFSKNFLPGILCIDDSTVNVDFIISFSLRKHIYVINRFSKVVKIEKFKKKNNDNFSYFSSNHRL